MSETITLDVHESTFEVARAISAYIPLLAASYSLAQGMPIVLPAGYTEIGRVETGAGIVASMAGGAMDPQALPEAAAMAMANVNPDLFGFVVRENATGAVIVAIRGTLVPLEWLRNFTAIPVPYQLVPDFGDVHLGFRETWKLVRDSVRQHLQGVPVQMRITVVGHSLGGAMATMAGPDIVHNFGHPVVDVCTVGSPRAGRSDFRDRFDALIGECPRVVNQFDIVPHVPTLVTGWRHVGEEVEVDGSIANAHSLSTYLAGLMAIGSGGALTAEAARFSSLGLTSRAADVNRLLAARIP